MNLVIAAALLLWFRLCAASPPSLDYLLPAAVMPGNSIDVSFHGKHLQSPTAIWTNIPAVDSSSPNCVSDVASDDPAPDRIHCRLGLPADAAVGIYGVRIATTGGLSNLKLIMVDDLPSGNDNGKNETRSTAQEIALPIAIDGACDRESSDFFKLHLAAGQRISVDAVARRLGSPLDPVLRLLDADGQQLLECDDVAGIGPDCHFVYHAPRAGTYFLEIRDVRYQGGRRHRYRLRIGDFPLATSVFPLAGRVGTRPKLVLAGPAVDASVAVDLRVPSAESGGTFYFGVRNSAAGGSAFGSMVMSHMVEQIEFEPNDTPETACIFTLPGAMNGRFAAAKDHDYFQLEAQTGQRLVFKGQARSLGSPSDLYMRLYQSDGTLLAEAEDSPQGEGILDVKIPARGVYRLQVEDLMRRGGAPYVYRIVAEYFRQGFSLAADKECLNAPRGGVFVAKVTCTRHDYQGPIKLSIEGEPGDIELKGNVIGSDANETTLVGTLPLTIEPGQLRELRIVGRAESDDIPVTIASTRIPLRSVLAGLSYPPPDLDGRIGLGVGPPFPDFFRLAATPSPVLLPQLINSARLKVAVTRLNDFNGAVDLKIENLPESIHAQHTSIDEAKNEVDLELSAVGAIAAGDYPIRILGTATFQDQPKSVVLDDVVVRVCPPLQLAVSSPETMSRGNTQPLKVALTRLSDEVGPVSIAFKHLPVGVKAPAETTISAEQCDANIDLLVSSEASIGEFELVVVATATVKNRHVVVESAPVHFQVK